jgi:hypothetical protein
MKPHAFVAMPFGIRPGADGQPIDFDRVYTDYVRPSLEAAGLDVVRAAEELRGGGIRADDLQELVLADLMVADLTLDDPTVRYELGVRHALRARGVVLLLGGRTAAAFDRDDDLKLRYSLSDGAPDRIVLEDERRRLTEMAEAAMESWHGRMLSPLFRLMPNLPEPDWRSLRVGEARKFWELQEVWAARIDLARQTGRIGDLLVLADENPVAARRADAWIKAGEALCKAGEHGYALEQLERGLQIEPDNIEGLREKNICLLRLAQAGNPEHSVERERWRPRRVFLFSGHMVDVPGRSPARFPNSKAAVAAARIGEALDRFGAGPDDLALTQGASGGDLLFAEACQQRGVRVQLLLPFGEAEFIQRSILPSEAGEEWRERFQAVRDRCPNAPRIMPEELGPLPRDSQGREASPFERCNLWLLYTALACGPDRVRFVCLWNGGGGDGPGGTAHMYGEVKRRTGMVAWIDSRDL